MALSKATHGHGTQLWINLGAGLVRVAELDDFPELPSFETELYETTNFDTVGVKEHKKLPLTDGVPISVRGNYVINSGSDTLLAAAAAEQEALEYRVVVPEGADVYHWDGFGLFYNFKRMNPKDAKRTFEIMLKPVTAPSITEAP